MEEKLQECLGNYVQYFNDVDDEIYIQKYDNDHSLEWMLENVPLLDCPDKVLEEIYYFRWWTFRKHFMDTPEGVLISEFLAKVEWAGEYNTISAANCFHIRAGRWLRNCRAFIENYIRFWLFRSNSSHAYSNWLSWAVMEYCETTGKKEFGVELLPKLIEDYERWENEQLNTEIGLFWSHDGRDAMEMSISGNGYRPTLNSYMYAGAKAISKIAGWANDHKVASIYATKAEVLREKVQTLLWDEDFFKVIPAENMELVNIETDFEKIPPMKNAKEQIGYIPWYFDLPEKGKGYEKAFTYLSDSRVFDGKCGLRTADASHPRYNYEVDHECLWNGPSWPFATSQTLVAASNIVEDKNQKIFSANDYYRLLKMYAQCHYRKLEDGSIIPWIDENLDPENGEWIARKILKDMGWREDKGGYERGKDYNHSLFCDLIISGLFGIRADENHNIEVNPKFPVEGDDAWEYCMLDKVPIGNELYRIQYDKTGEHYHAGSGMKIIKLNV